MLPLVSSSLPRAQSLNSAEKGLFIHEYMPLSAKTTMRIGGTARFYAEVRTKEDLEEAVSFAKIHSLPLVILGGGSNTIFEDGEIAAVVIRIKADNVSIDKNTVRIESGKILAVLLNELAAQGLDLSPLTGIPGSVGGAVFGNAGQGPQGLWSSHFLHSIECLYEGKWHVYSHADCNFRYRNSVFKDLTYEKSSSIPPIIWQSTLTVPDGTPEKIMSEMKRLLSVRMDTQPHIKTAGSCFKAYDGTPAWQLIDTAGLRGKKIGGIEIAEKHANFLLNTSDGSFEDATRIVKIVRDTVKDPLEVEMRFFQRNGHIFNVDKE